MKIRTSELSGAALDWAVAKCEGYDCQLDCEVSGPWLVPQEGYLHDEKPLSRYSPSTLWAQGGPIIERERITWNGQCASIVKFTPNKPGSINGTYNNTTCYSPAPLIAAMRCYVASKMGDTIDVPDSISPIG